jgi:UDP-2,4-diacetamido-2,4,6-trideoxy-beta-L-altropyranose hydrolase
MKVAIRTDASPTMGTGHLMRCLTLADALRVDGAEVTFLCALSTVPWSRLVEDRRHQIRILDERGEGLGDGDLRHSSWLPWGQVADADATATALAGPADWLVVDHYGLDARWEMRMRAAGRKVMAIDDLADRAHDCDLLLDHNPQVADRYDSLVPPTADRLIGPRYALLRPEFATARGTLHRGVIERIAVFMSGTDPEGSTLMVLAALAESDLRDIELDVVIGGASPHIAAVKAAAERRGRATVHVDTPDIAGLFARADLAVGGGGVAALERSCVGVPSITIAIADNQIPGLEVLRNRGAVAHLGDIAMVSAEIMSAMVRRLRNSPAQLEALAETAASVVDGKGTGRIVAAMMGGSEGLSVRRATMDDAARLHLWRNDDAVRAVSFSSEPIPYDDHCRWLERAVSDPNRIILVGTLSQTPVGTVRYDIAGDRATVSVVVPREAQGRGIGTALLDAGEAYLGNVARVARIDAEIKPDNVASLRLFARAGFAPAPSEAPGRVLYVRRLPAPFAHKSYADV